MRFSKSPSCVEGLLASSRRRGLGLRNLGAWNNALLAKMLWNVHLKADSLWIKWIYNEYIKQNSIWTWKVKEKDSLVSWHLLLFFESALVRLPCTVCF